MGLEKAIQYGKEKRVMEKLWRDVEEAPLTTHHDWQRKLGAECQDPLHNGPLEYHCPQGDIIFYTCPTCGKEGCIA